MEFMASRLLASFAITTNSTSDKMQHLMDSAGWYALSVAMWSFLSVNHKSWMTTQPNGF